MTSGSSSGAFLVFPVVVVSDSLITERSSAMSSFETKLLDFLMSAMLARERSSREVAQAGRQARKGSVSESTTANRSAAE